MHSTNVSLYVIVCKTSFSNIIRTIVICAHSACPSETYHIMTSTTIVSHRVIYIYIYTYYTIQSVSCIIYHRSCRISYTAWHAMHRASYLIRRDVTCHIVCDGRQRACQHWLLIHMCQLGWGRNHAWIIQPLSHSHFFAGKHIVAYFVLGPLTWHPSTCHIARTPRLTHICVYIYICIHIYIYINIYTYIYIHILSLSLYIYIYVHVRCIIIVTTIIIIIIVIIIVIIIIIIIIIMINNNCYYCYY